MRIIFLGLFCSCLLIGCSLVNTFTPPNADELHKYNQWIRSQEALFEPYIGKTDAEILQQFGKPKEIYKTRRPTWTLPYDGDEMWRYGEELSIGQAQGATFLFKDGRLLHVELMGRRQSNSEKVLNSVLN